MLAKATGKGSLEEIRDLAARLGADVPLFLQGGAVLMEGIGEVLSPLNPLPLWAVIVKPDFGMSTPAVYRAWDDGSFETRGDTQALLENWPPSAERLGGHIGNDLERAAEALGFDLTKWLGPLREVKALGCGMTGSGSAVFGLFEDESTAEAANLAVSERLAKDVHNKPFSNYCVPFTTRGVEIL
jgi:4-diphosphocytidyl-2-C-methyl-D-erythritol kinase